MSSTSAIKKITELFLSEDRLNADTGSEQCSWEKDTHIKMWQRAIGKHGYWVDKNEKSHSL